MAVGLPRACRAVRGQMEGAEERREGGKGQAGIKLSPKLLAGGWMEESFCPRLLLNSALGQRLSIWSNTNVDVPKNVKKVRGRKAGVCLVLK